MIYGCVAAVRGRPSPSLRGSGLKFRRDTVNKREYRLPLYEGVD